MTDLDERIYYREEQSQPFLTVTSGQPPDSLNDDGGLAVETTTIGLRAEGTTWMGSWCPNLPRADAIEAKIS